MELKLKDILSYFDWKDELYICIVDSENEYEYVEDFRADNAEKVKEYKDCNLVSIDNLENIMLVCI